MRPSRPDIICDVGNFIIRRTTATLILYVVLLLLAGLVQRTALREAARNTREGDRYGGNKCNKNGNDYICCCRVWLDGW